MRKELIAFAVFIMFLGNYFNLYAQEERSPAINEAKELPVVKLPSPDTVMEVTRKPQILNLNEVGRMISYPDVMKETNMQGKVVIRLLVDTLGNVIKYLPKSSPHAILTEAVVMAVYKLKYSPATGKDGKPVYYWVDFPYNFILK